MIGETRHEGNGRPEQGDRPGFWERREAIGQADLTDLKGKPKIVLVRLDEYAGTHGDALPSQARLAADVDLTDRALRNTLAALRDAGLLTIVHGRRCAASYFIN